jgi:hypothetical protein
VLGVETVNNVATTTAVIDSRFMMASKLHAPAAIRVLLACSHGAGPQSSSKI